MHVGIIEIVMIVCVAAVCLGPEKLPVYAKKFGHKLAELKLQYSIISQELQTGVDELQRVQDVLENPLDQQSKKGV